MKESTEAATFRFDRAILEQLKLEARHKQISLNTLLNQIVRAHLEWHSNAARAGFVPVRKTVITKLFDSLTPEQIDVLARNGARGLADETLLIMSKKRSGASILEVTERWIRVAGFSYHHEVGPDDNNNHMYVIQHNMGRNWSYYLARLFEEATSEFVAARPDVEATENALYITVAFK